MVLWLCLVGVLWVGCGLLSYGWKVAYCFGRWPDLRSKEQDRKDRILAATFALFGPASLGGDLIMGNYDYGWRW